MIRGYEVDVSLKSARSFRIQPCGELAISSAVYKPTVSVNVEIRSVVGVKLDVEPEAETITFDVKARLEERERRSQHLIVEFTLAIGTRPALAKFEVSGVAHILGKDEEIGEMLEIDPETNIPKVFHSVYQHAFLTVYLLSTVLKVPPPPSNLLGSETPISPLPAEEATEVSETAEDSGEAAEVEQPQVEETPAGAGAEA